MSCSVCIVRTAFRSPFSPSTVWVLRVELRLPGVYRKHLTHGAVFPALVVVFIWRLKDIKNTVSRHFQNASTAFHDFRVLSLVVLTGSVLMAQCSVPFTN